MTPLVVSVAEAAQLLGVSNDVVYRWLDAGHLPELPRVTRRRLIPRRAIDALIDKTMEGFAS